VLFISSSVAAAAGIGNAVLVTAIAAAARQEKNPSVFFHHVSDNLLQLIQKTRQETISPTFLV